MILAFCFVLFWFFSTFDLFFVFLPYTAINSPNFSFSPYTLIGEKFLLKLVLKEITSNKQHEGKDGTPTMTVKQCCLKYSCGALAQILMSISYNGSLYKL